MKYEKLCRIAKKNEANPAPSLRHLNSLYTVNHSMQFGVSKYDISIKQCKF